LNERKEAIVLEYGSGLKEKVKKMAMMLAVHWIH
jgi:hypothetical protein